MTGEERGGRGGEVREGKRQNVKLAEVLEECGA